MKIIQLVLKKYNRFKLSNIQNFNYKPVATKQIIIGRNGEGKANPVHSKIKIPGGWTTMGEVQVGDTITAADGSPTKVLSIHPQGIQKFYRITFSDGRTAECTLDHLWKVYWGKTYPVKPEVVTTKTLMERLQSSKRMERLLWIDLCQPEQSLDKTLPVDPYILGVIIGDGTTAKVTCAITNPDEEIREKIDSRLRDGVSTVVYNSKYPKSCPTYSFVYINKEGRQKPNYINKYLRECGMSGKRSYEKTIPDEYMNASTDQKIQLLQGLMDTDGFVGKHGTTSYSTSSQALALQVRDLVRSLGWIAHVTSRIPHCTLHGERVPGRRAYRVRIRSNKPSSLFYLPRKKVRTNDDNQYAPTLRLRIESIVLQGATECKCITIDHPDKLYITDNYVVTHNSSALKELSPLPANHRDYALGGSKYIKISHRGSIYELTSDFASGNKHSFIKDAVELNTGNGNYTTQLQLVKDHLGITPAIHELALGVRRFTDMSVAERRSWFTQLSDTNYDYAVAVYNKLKEKHRDITGALKIAKRKFDIEHIKVFAPDEIKALEEKVSILYKLLETLMEYRKPVETDSDEIMRQIDSIHESMEESIQEAVKALNVLRASTADIPTLEAQLEQLNLIQSQNQALSNSYYQDFENIDKQYKLASSLKEHSIAEVEHAIKTIHSDIGKFKEKLVYGLDIDTNPQSAAIQARQVSEKIEKLLPTLIEYTNRGFTHESLRDAKQAIDISNETLKQMNIKIDKLESILEHYEALKEDKEVVCPNCSHHWILGFDQVKYNKTQAVLVKVREDRKELTDKLEALTRSAQQMSEYLTSYDNVLSIFNYTQALDSLWQKIMSEGLLDNDPANIPFVIEEFAKDLTVYTEIDKLYERIQEKELILKQLKDSGDLNFEYISSQRKTIELKITQLTKNIKTCSDEIESIKKLLNASQTLTRIREGITSALQKRSEATREAIEAFRRATYNELIRAIQALLNEHETRLHSATNHTSIVANIQKQIAEFEKQKELLDLALKELSPTEGLIAEGLFGFMKLFIAEMNTVIKKIWTYPLVVAPCALDKEGNLDLDYKFPVMVDTDDNVRKDISEGSSAMLEVINLAFKITAFKALGLYDYPLYLDEFGSTMDPTHKAATITLINTIMEREHFSQLFMISHDAVQYGALSNTEVTVLSKQNMQMPKGSVYNQAATIN